MNLELFAYPEVQIHAAGDHIAAEDARMLVGYVKAMAKILVRFPSKKGDLTFVILLMIEIAIADQSLAGPAFDSWDGNDRVPASGMAVVSIIVVARRNVDGDDSRNEGHAPIY